MLLVLNPVIYSYASFAYANCYVDHYVQPMNVEAVTQSVCDLALGFGEGRDKKKEGQPSMSRPFGVALLVAGVDLRGPQLFFSDPSGTLVQYKAKAIGAGSEGAQATLEDKYRGDMSLADAEDLALEILRQVMEEKLAVDNIEVASATPARVGGIYIYIYIYIYNVCPLISKL
jgi:20S proteasome subunit alpha 5